MSKINITVPFDAEKLSALDFCLEKENDSAQKRMEQALTELYEKTVPEPLREYLDSKAAPATSKPKRPARQSASKPQPAPPKPVLPAVPISDGKEEKLNG
ncbi:DUF6103 family protein [Oscillibacter sp.]|jgi:hypothetical protein|uniref:DUF6103 family protein n=1 Tax=Oscillibacter sp. TaxID=1945593 RepID=UPI00289C107D|nr:DUF6103 family protein [Oscillibacter sp.]